MPNRKNPAWYGGALWSGMPDGGLGSVFYCNGTAGNDANSGETPDAPTLTLTAALALCTPNHDDYIIVQDYWQPAGETWPIDVNVDKVHIIGANGGGAPWAQMQPPGDTASLSISAHFVEIAFLSPNGGATHGCIEINAAGLWGILIHDCWLGVAGTGQDGIRDVAPNDAPYLTIYGNRFGQGLTRDGVRIDHNATRGLIGAPGYPPNYFDEVGGVAINLVGNCAQIGIHDNIISIPANTAGAAVTLSAGCADCCINGNHANFGDTDMGNNPFADGAGAGANNWLTNWKGSAVGLPS